MKTPKIILSADPGPSGAIALINSNMEVLRVIDWPEVKTFKMVKKRGSDKKIRKATRHHEQEIFKLFKIFEDIGLIPSKQGIYKDVSCIIEKVWAHSTRPGKDGEQRNMGISSTSKLIGSHWSLITFFTIISGNEPVLVPARTWQKDVLKKKNGDGIDTKKASLQTAAALFPDAAKIYLTRKMDHGRSDALLLGYWLMRYGG
ncbi:hypothetical protein KAR10_09895 [bacterium]|nr:hypothetical protein [bacterium]